VNTISKRFNDKLFVIGYRLAFWFYRRRSPKAVAAEPVRADGQAGTMPHAMRWLAAPSAPAKSLEEALRGWDVSYGVPQRRSADVVSDPANPTHH
jgi:hypothetical protein